MNTFEKMSFRGFIYKTIEDLGFTKPTPIQEKVLPLIKKGRDVIGISQTGTGKTHAYLFPLLNRIDFNKEEVQIVITTPTRELAVQIYEHIRKFQKYEPQLNAALIIGGVDRQKTIQRLNTQPHIVVGTPGRIKDLSLDTNALKITTAKAMVIDEADMTLDLGYLDDIDAVAGKMRDNLQMCVFSATIPQSLRPFLRKYMHNPELVEIEKHKKTNTNIEHILVWTKHRDRLAVLDELMNCIDPYLCIIFENTRDKAKEVAKRLYNQGLKVGEIHGDLTPRQRSTMMRRINNNEFVYIVATDIAARGIDIDGVSHIINMGFPKELDFYIHRSGRTGRASYTGYCYSLYDSTDEKVVKQLENKGIEFKNVEIKNHEITVVDKRDRRKKKPHQPTETEIQIQKIVSRPTKVKPGYKKKRQRQVQELVRKQKRQMIRDDIRRQKKERARLAQAKRNEALRGED